MISLHIDIFENSPSIIMNSVIFQETAKLKKPVPAERVLELSAKLMEPSSHSKNTLQDYIKHGEPLFL